MPEAVDLTRQEKRAARLNYNADVRAELERRDAVTKAVDRLMEGLDSELESGRPDARNRRESAMAILAYAQGRPVEMVLQVRENIGGAVDGKALMQNPATITALVAQAEAAGVLPALLDALKAKAEKPARLREVDGETGK